MWGKTLTAALDCLLLSGAEITPASPYPPGPSSDCPSLDRELIHPPRGLEGVYSRSAQYPQGEGGVFLSGSSKALPSRAPICYCPNLLQKQGMWLSSDLAGVSSRRLGRNGHLLRFAFWRQEGLKNLPSLSQEEKSTPCM